MIERLRDGNEEPCSHKDIRAGDWFRTRDVAGTSPWLEAAEDATLIPHPTKPGHQVWAITPQPHAVEPL